MISRGELSKMLCVKINTRDKLRVACPNFTDTFLSTLEFRSFYALNGQNGTRLMSFIRYFLHKKAPLISRLLQFLQERREKASDLGWKIPRRFYITFRDKQDSSFLVSFDLMLSASHESLLQKYTQARSSVTGGVPEVERMCARWSLKVFCFRPKSHAALPFSVIVCWIIFWE